MRFSLLGIIFFHLSTLLSDTCWKIPSFKYGLVCFLFSSSLQVCILGLYIPYHMTTFSCPTTNTPLTYQGLDTTPPEVSCCDWQREAGSGRGSFIDQACLGAAHSCSIMIWEVWRPWGVLLFCIFLYMNHSSVGFVASPYCGRPLLRGSATAIGWRSWRTTVKDIIIDIFSL